MVGSSNVVITIVGADTDEITQLAQNMIEDEYHAGYNPFGPDDAPKGPSLTDFMSLAGDAEVVEFTVSGG